LKNYSKAAPTIPATEERQSRQGCDQRCNKCITQFVSQGIVPKHMAKSQIKFKSMIHEKIHANTL
jgi:hypothetical protein